MLNKLVAQNASGTVQDCCCQYTSILQLVTVEVGRKKSSRMGKNCGIFSSMMSMQTGFQTGMAQKQARNFNLPCPCAIRNG